MGYLRAALARVSRAIFEGCGAKLLAVVLFLVHAVPSAALAWGNDGHRISGEIARPRLTAQAREAIVELLGHDDLARVATRFDEDREGFERKFRGAARWHYENRSVCSGAIECPRGDCITRQLERFIAILADRTRAPSDRQDALTIVVHLIGDLHQPLHLADNRDRGGNDTWVRLPSAPEPRRLHEVWDTEFVRRGMQRRSAVRYAPTLVQRYSASLETWSRGTLADWSRETDRLGAQYAYRALPSFVCRTRRADGVTPIALSQDYIDDAERIVAEQLTRAGVRIAAVLNKALAH